MWETWGDVTFCFIRWNFSFRAVGVDATGAESRSPPPPPPFLNSRKRGCRVPTVFSSLVIREWEPECGRKMDIFLSPCFRVVFGWGDEAAAAFRECGAEENILGSIYQQKSIYTFLSLSLRELFLANGSLCLSGLKIIK